MAKGLFDDAKLGVPCPECGEKAERTVRSLRAKTKYDCPGCGKSITPSDDFKEAFARAQRAVDGFGKGLRGFKKR